MLICALAGSARALEVRTPGAAPTLVVQVPDGAVVNQQPGQVEILLAPNTFPILNMGVLVFDPTKIDLASPDVYPVLATDVLKNIAQSAGGSVVRQSPGSRVLIAGKPGFIYRSVIENEGGGQLGVEVALMELDTGHVGLFALISAQGKESADGLEAAMRAATLATQ
jgi:hypothetical protein